MVLSIVRGRRRLESSASARNRGSAKLRLSYHIVNIAKEAKKPKAINDKMTSKRRRSSTGDGDDLSVATKRARIISLDRLSQLPHELLIRILHNLPIDTLLQCQTISHHFYTLAGDSELWKSLFYDRFVLPRALRIPGMRAAQPTVALHFSSRKSKWLDDNTLVNRVDGKKTNWKSQYKLRHNWAIGACEMQEIHVADYPSVPEMLVKLVEGLVFTADKTDGLRAWSLKEKSLIAQCEVGGIPTCLAVEEQTGVEGLGIAIGFEDGSWGTWRFNGMNTFEEVYKHPASSTGMLSAVAFSKPYVLTITDSQLMSLYTFKPSIQEEGEASQLDTEPRLLASLKSHTSWPPLSLSIRTTTSTIIASIAYSLPTYLSGYTVGLQELHLSLDSGEITFSRLASALPQGFTSILSTTSSPSSGTSTPSSPRSTLSRPTSLSYSHPYILATHPDNTLTLYLCTSTASILTISPGTKLWGHTSSVSSAEITPRGKAVSVSTRGNELRVWELEGGFSTPSKKRASIARLSERSVRVRIEDKDQGGVEEKWQEETKASKRWVGFDDEMVIVLKEDGKGSQALMVYDFT